MDFKEKLEKAAEDFAYGIPDIGGGGDFTIFHVMDGFEQGAEWLMGQPLSERLTDDERKEYQELRLYANYVYHWGHSPVVCKKCGNLNPSGYICATCGWDNTYDPDEED